MERTDALAILDKINTLLASEGNTQQVQAYVAQLKRAGYPLKETRRGDTVVRYRPEIAARRRT